MASPDRTLILNQLLKLVPFDGWTDYAFAQAIAHAKLDEAAAARAFPGGVDECITYFFSEEDAALAKRFPESSLAGQRVPQRIESLLLWRFEHLLPHREAVRRAIARQAMPWNTARSLRSLYDTIDLIWRLAGDTSVDFNFYTKRMTLAGVYTSTLLFWLDDTSDDHADTHAFLSRRLGNVADFGRWKKSLTDTFKRKVANW